MPEEINVATKQETSEVILPPGSGSTAGALSDIFSQIESAKSEGKSAAEVIAESQAQKQEKPEEKEEVKEVAKTEVKAEESDLAKKLDDTQKKKDEDGEVSREKLRAATEEKKEAVKEEKKEVVEKKEDDVPEEELKVLSSDKPKTAKRIQALLRRAETLNSEVTKTKAEAQEKATKLAELEKKLAEVKTVDPATDAKIKEQLDELKMYRRRYELDKDPEVKTKFDARVESAEKSITETLTRRNAGQKLLDLIKEEGGWAKFSESARPVSISDGEGGTKQVMAAELADQILQALPLGERKAVEAAMMEQFQTKRDKDRYLKEQQDAAVTYFKKKEEETLRQTEEYQKQVDATANQLREFEEKALKQEWIQDKVIDPKATPAEKAAIEEHNKYNAQLRSLYKKALTKNDLNSLLEMVNDSVRFYDERRTTNNLRSELARLKADLAAKQAEIDRFKGAGRTVPKAGSIATSPTSTSESRPERPRDISDAFDRLERGERLVVTSGGEE